MKVNRFDVLRILEKWLAGPGRRAEKADRHPARSEGPGLAAQASRKEGIALPVARQSDPGGGDEEGEPNLAGSVDKSILMHEPQPLAKLFCGNRS